MFGGKQLKIGIIGAGIVGSALAVQLREKGYEIASVASRRRISADHLATMVEGCQSVNTVQEVADLSDMVFITTPDDVIPVVAGSVKWHKGQYVVHCSGADSVDILDAPAKMAATVGVFHPLQTFASVSYAIQNIPGSTFGIEAEEPLLGILKQMAEKLEGRWVRIKSEDKVLYHAAAVIACNYFYTIEKLATDLWQVFGVQQSEAINALMPLIRGSINNLHNIGLPHCLTGPIARGDTGTIKKHIKALEASTPQLLSTYKELGLQTIPIAIAKGRLTAAKAKEIEKLFGK